MVKVSTILAPVAVMAAVLMSGLVNINFEHHLNLPKELTNQNHIRVSKHVTVYGVNQVSEIYMVGAIKSQRQMENVIVALNEANTGDVINLHLAGNGGDAEVEMRIVNSIRASKATVNALVEGPVYSAHAYIAVSAETLTMSPYSYLMFHSSSAFGYNCADIKDPQGLDRAITNQQSCENMLKYHMDLTNKEIQELKWLTDDEKFMITTGHEVYVTPEQIAERQAKQ